MRHLIDAYNTNSTKLERVRDADNLADLLDASIKWTRAVKNDLRKGVCYEFDRSLLIEAQYRPFVKRWLYFSRQLNEVVYQTPLIFGNGNVRNRSIVLTDPHRAEALDDMCY